MHSKMLSAMVAVVFGLPACVGADADGSTGGNTSGGEVTSSSSQTGSGSTSTGTGGTTSGELTLDNCVTSVDEGVPDFYKTYFKCATIKLSGSNVVITTKGLPPHKTNYYGPDSPNYVPFDTSRGTQYGANPNNLSAQNVTLTIPLAPVSRNATIDKTTVNGQVNMGTSEYRMGPAGVAIDSVVMYNPLAAPGDDIAKEKYTFDDYNAHPDMSKTYHYHTDTTGPLEVLKHIGLVTNTTLGKAEIELFGVMCDGTPVLGCTELDGSAPKTAELDAQNGHVHDVVGKDGKVLLAKRYHTHICAGFTDATHMYTPEIQYYTTCNITTK